MVHHNLVAHDVVLVLQEHAFKFVDLYVCLQELLVFVKQSPGHLEDFTFRSNEPCILLQVGVLQAEIVVV